MVKPTVGLTVSNNSIINKEIKMRHLLTTVTLILIMGCTEQPSVKTAHQPIIEKPNNTSIEKKALIVGVSDYKGEAHDLDGVKIDVVNMENLFHEWGFDVTVVKDKDSMNLEDYLERYERLDSNDKFIFYYSGHGSHTKDESGDEDDGEDEALVLSDGEENELFLDDSLFGYLNSIKAQKMVMLDSCHSGTAFKAFDDNQPKPKSLASDMKHLFKVIKTKIFPTTIINSGEYVVFSASQDKEQSLDTQTGGMFTKAFYKEMRENNGKEKRMENLRGAMANNIRTWCKSTNSKAHHPNLSASSDRLRYRSIGEFLGL